MAAGSGVEKAGRNEGRLSRVFEGAHVLAPNTRSHDIRPLRANFLTM